MLLLKTSLLVNYKSKFYIKLLDANLIILLEFKRYTYNFIRKIKIIIEYAKLIIKNITFFNINYILVLNKQYSK